MWYLLNGIFLRVAAVSGSGTIVVFLEGLLTLSNVKILEIIDSRKLRGKVDDPFGLKSFFSYINIPGKFLA